MIHVKSRSAGRHRLVALALLLAAAGVYAQAGSGLRPPSTAPRAAVEGTPQQLPTVQLTAGMHLIRAMVARTPEEQQIGLMFRREMGANEGMLFVFDDLSMRCFWMKNTLLPLSAAFVADDGSIVNIADMKPLDETSHCSTRPVRYVLEMHQGWFAKRGLRAGSRIGGLGERASR